MEIIQFHLILKNIQLKSFPIFRSKFKTIITNTTTMEWCAINQISLMALEELLKEVTTNFLMANLKMESFMAILERLITMLIVIT